MFKDIEMEISTKPENYPQGNQHMLTMVKSKSRNPKSRHDIHLNRDSVVASMFNKLSYDAGRVCHNGLLWLEFKSGILVTQFTTIVAKNSFSRF